MGLVVIGWSPCSKVFYAFSLRYEILKKNILFRMSSTISYLLCPDDCGESTASPVADLVRGLISLGSALTTCDEDQAKVVLCEVANCLGDIGAVELSTVLLGSKTRTGNAGSFHTVH